MGGNRSVVRVAADGRPPGWPTICREAVCPGCGTASSRVHGRYRRRPADLAVPGREVVSSR
ncbi:transposase family protein [Streptomyces sp. OZ13]|uniref:transposase family protein n=1 Tax=Streptomyces sp. OZ13 TaxID=3452210 RepID=UPI003F8A4F3C